MGIVSAFPATMASGTNSATFNLGFKAWLNCKFVVPTMTSTSALDVYQSVDNVTYYQMRNAASTSSVQVATFTVPATMGANGGIMPINNYGPYMKIIATDSAPTAATTFYVICSD